MKRYPAGAGCDDDPRRRPGIAAEGRAWGGVSSPLSSAAARIVVSAHSGRPYSLYSPGRTGESVGLVGCPNTGSIACERATGLTVRATELTVPLCECTDSSHLPAGSSRTAELGTEAAEILISPSGGVPAARGEAAATSERSERERVAVRFAVEAVCCGVVGCQRSDGLLRVETPHGPRVLCPAHLRRWGQ